MEPKHPPSSLPPLQLRPIVNPPNKQTPPQHQTHSGTGQPVGTVAGINPMLMKPVLSKSKSEQAAAIEMAMAKKAYNEQHTNAIANGGSSSSSTAVYSPLREGGNIDTNAQAKPPVNPTSSLTQPMKPMTPEGIRMAEKKASLGLTGTGNRMIISAKPVPPTNSVDLSGQYMPVVTQRGMSNQSDEGKDAIPLSSQLQPSHGIDHQYYQLQSTNVPAGEVGGGRGNVPNTNLLNPPKPILQTSTSRRSNNSSPYGTLQSKPGTISEKASVRFKPILEQASISSKSSKSQVTPVDDNAFSLSEFLKNHGEEEEGGFELVPYERIRESLLSNHHKLTHQLSNHTLSNRGLFEVGNWRSSAMLLGQGKKAEKHGVENTSFVDKDGHLTKDSLGHQNDTSYHPMETKSQELKRMTQTQDRTCRKSMTDQMKRGWNMITHSHANMMAWKNRTFSPAETKKRQDEKLGSKLELMQERDHLNEDDFPLFYCVKKNDIQMLRKKLEELKGRKINCPRNGAAPVDDKKFPQSHARSVNKHIGMLRMLQERLIEERKEMDQNKLKEEERDQGSKQKDTEPPLAAYIRKENGGHPIKKKDISNKDTSSGNNSSKDPPDVIERYLDETQWHTVREENGYHMMKGSIWAMVSRHEMLSMSGDRAEVMKRDSAGATVFHVAFLSKRYEIARMLVEHYPYEALFPIRGGTVVEGAFPGRGNEVIEVYDPKTNKTTYQTYICEENMPYTGENVLHITISFGNVAETRWLLDFYRAHEHSVPHGLERLLISNANGTVFRLDGGYYYGGFPLLWAVSCGIIAIFDLVLAYAASIDPKDEEGEKELVGMFRDKHSKNCDIAVASYAKQFLGPNVIFMRDVYGNNALHLCVMRCKVEMYKHVLEKADAQLRIEIRAAYLKEVDQVNKMVQKITKLQNKEPKEVESVCLELQRTWTFKLPAIDVDVSKDEGFGYVPKEKSLFLPLPSQAPTLYEDGAWLDAATTAKLGERLTLCLNEDRHSPLTLAAVYPFRCGTQVQMTRQIREANRKDKSKNDEVAKSKKEQLKALLDIMSKVPSSSVGPMSVSLLDLQGVETAYHHDDYLPRIAPSQDMFGVIEWLCIAESNNCLTIPALQHLIEVKWARCGWPEFSWSMLSHLIVTLCFTVLTCLINGNVYYSKPGPFKSDVAVSIVYPIACALVIRMSFFDFFHALVHFVEKNHLRDYFSDRTFLEGCMELWKEIKRSLLSHPTTLQNQHHHHTILSSNKNNHHKHKHNIFRRLSIAFEIFVKIFVFLFKLPYTVTVTIPYKIIHLLFTFVLAGTRGAAAFNRLMRYIIALTFGIHVLFELLKYLHPENDWPYSNEVVLPLYNNLNITDFNTTTMAYDSTLNVYYLPVDDINVQLPLIICVMTSWLLFYYFLMGIDGTGPMAITISRIVTRDVPFFLMFFFVIVVAFALSLSMLGLNKGDPQVAVGFYDFMVVFWVLIKTTVGGGSTAYNFGLDEQYVIGFQQYATNVPKNGQWPNNQIIFDLLMMLYSFCSNLLLINLLIALMSNTYNFYNDNSDSLLLMEKFNIMCAEENVSAYLFIRALREKRQKYAIEPEEIAHKKMEVGGASSLHLAARDGHLAVVQHLVHTGHAIDEKGGKHGLTPLHRAAERGHLSVVLYLLQHGANIWKPSDHSLNNERELEDVLKDKTEPHTKPLFTLLMHPENPLSAMAEYNKIVWEDVIRRGLTDVTKREHTCWDPKDGGLIARSAIYDAISGHLINATGAKVDLDNDESYGMFGYTSKYKDILKSLKERQNRRKYSHSPSSQDLHKDGDGIVYEDHALATSHKESGTTLEQAKNREKAVADSKRLLYWIAMHGPSQLPTDHQDNNNDDGALDFVSNLLYTLEQDIVEEKTNGVLLQGGGANVLDPPLTILTDEKDKKKEEERQKMVSKIQEAMVAAVTNALLLASMYGRDDVVRSIINYQNSPHFPEYFVVATVLPDRYVAGGLALPLVLAAMFGRLDVLKTLVQHTRERASAVLSSTDSLMGGSGGGGSMTKVMSRPSFDSIPSNYTNGVSTGSIVISNKSVNGGGSGGIRSASPSFMSGDISTVDVFEQIDHASYTLLHHAAVHGHLNVTEYLLGYVYRDKGLDKNQIEEKKKLLKNRETPHGRTPLILAVEYMRPKSHIHADKPLTMETADQGRLQVFQALILAGADLEQKDKNGRTPLIVAASHGLLDVMKSSLYGKTPGKSDEEFMFLACLHDRNNDRNNTNHQTALHAAASGGHLPVVEFLINMYQKFGPNDDVKTPLVRVAGNSGKDNVVRSLDRRRSSVISFKVEEYLNATDKDDMTPLMRAAIEGHVDVVNYFLTEHHHIIKTTAQDTRGRTALILAADAMKAMDNENELSSEPDRARADVIKLLVDPSKNTEAKKLVNIADHDRRTALIVAAGNGLGDVVLTLINGGADLNMAKKDGSTAIKKAAVWGHQGVVELLKKNGAKITSAELHEYRHHTDVHLALKLTQEKGEDLMDSHNDTDNDHYNDNDNAKTISLLIIDPQVDFHPRLDENNYYEEEKRRKQEKKEKEKRKKDNEETMEEQKYDGSLPPTPTAKGGMPTFADGGDGGDQCVQVQIVGLGTESDDKNSNQKKSTAADNGADTTIKEGGSKIMIKPGVNYHPGGSLQVPGANDDSMRIAELIEDSLDVAKNTSSISSIFVTLDTHHKLHIAHKHSWKKGRVGQVVKTPAKYEGKPGTPEYKEIPNTAVYYEEGEHPNEFTTIISHNDVKNGVWKPADHLDEKWCVEYTRSLEANGKFQLIIWPEHCLIGSVGHSVVPCIANALKKWSKTTRKSVEYVKVGENIRTEAYSVFKAEVEDPSDNLFDKREDPSDKDAKSKSNSTAFNHELMNKLKMADTLIVCGQALSHCVKYTMEDIVAHFDEVSKAGVYLLEDGCSSVEGFKQVGLDFLTEMRNTGVQVTKAEDVMKRIKFGPVPKNNDNNDKTTGNNAGDGVSTTVVAPAAGSGVTAGGVTVTVPAAGGVAAPAGGGVVGVGMSPVAPVLDMSGAVADHQAKSEGAMFQWLLTHAPGIHPDTSLTYAKSFYTAKMATIERLAKKVSKESKFLLSLGVDEDDAEDIVQAMQNAQIMPGKS